MESYSTNNNSSSSSDPSHSQPSSTESSDALSSLFRSAAFSVTQLYKESQRATTKAYSEGYEAAVADLVQFLNVCNDAAGTSGSKSSSGSVVRKDENGNIWVAVDVVLNWAKGRLNSLNGGHDNGAGNNIIIATTQENRDQMTPIVDGSPNEVQTQQIHPQMGTQVSNHSSHPPTHPTDKLHHLPSSSPFTFTFSLPHHNMSTTLPSSLSNTSAIPLSHSFSASNSNPLSTPTAFAEYFSTQSPGKRKVPTSSSFHSRHQSRQHLTDNSDINEDLGDPESPDSQSHITLRPHLHSQSLGYHGIENVGTTNTEQVKLNLDNLSMMDLVLEPPLKRRMLRRDNEQDEHQDAD
ncbi:hypothetical protein BKA69DRAFT_1037215 [Paraphysoderma sedebokerense]|nr:hypothetical protein BKA69DRAFT_1037215 [Paraphysoderma sedebokerense]